MAVRLLAHMAKARMEQAGNEITELIDSIMEKKGQLSRPLADAPYFHKIPDREPLLDAGNVKQFVTEQKIKDFFTLECCGQEQEEVYKETERQLLSRKQKLRRLQELSSAFAACQPYIEVRKRHRDLRGLKAVLYENQHREELEKGDRLWEAVKRLLQDGEHLSPRQWEEQIRKLSAECKELSKKSDETIYKLAFVEVIRYNRKLYLAEQNREPYEPQIQHRTGPQMVAPEPNKTVNGRSDATSGKNKPSVLQALHEHQARIRAQEEQKQRHREEQPLKKPRSNTMENNR